MTQKQIILEYIDLHGSILPAKMAGQVFKGVMFGSETSKRCRELRKAGYLLSHREGKFEVYMRRVVSVDPIFQPLMDNLAPIRRLIPVDQLNYKQ